MFRDSEALQNHQAALFGHETRVFSGYVALFCL
jgi:hypothetical protein